MAQTDTLCGWGDQDKVDYFVQRSELLIPKRYEQLNTLVDLFPWPADQPIRVLDLGAGYGAVTETILNRYPQATVVWVDGSAAMQEHAEPRLAQYGQRVQLFLRDLADPAWSVELPGPFHAAVSAIALHHLTDLRKQTLCREVYELLLPGGMFLNNDVVTGAPEMREHSNVLFDGLLAKADVQRHRVHPGGLVTRELRQEAVVVRPQRHAAVIVPDEAVVEQSSRAQDVHAVLPTAPTNSHRFSID